MKEDLQGSFNEFRASQYVVCQNNEPAKKIHEKTMTPIKKIKGRLEKSQWSMKNTKRIQ